jgi:hypothetical protein
MNPWSPLGRLLIVLGVCLVLAGLAVLFWDKLPFGRLPFGRLPGDIVIERPRFKLYFPWVTGLVISIILTLLLNLFRK